MRRITALAYSIVYLLALPAIVFRLIRSSGPARLRQRLGFGLPRARRGCIWLHASSVGEVALLEPIVGMLEQRSPDTELLVTAFTSTGLATARARFPKHSVHALPFDFGFCVTRFLRHFDPRLVIVVEAEFWPRLLTELQRANVPVVALNVRMSQRSMRIHCFTRFVAQALRRIDAICVQDEENAERIRRLGVDPQRIHVTGNMKYDLVTPLERVPARSELGMAENAFVIVGGSLHEREDEALLDAVFSPTPVSASAAVIIAPRYPDAATQICAAARARGLRVLLKSEIDAGGAPSSNCDVCVIDTLGELRRLYALADVAFVGGSLFYRGSTRGGHNLMEPAICGVPVVFGPYNYSFADIAQTLVNNDGGLEVRDAAALRTALQALQRDPPRATSMGAAARRIVEAGQGATARNLSLVAAQLEQGCL